MASAGTITAGKATLRIGGRTWKIKDFSGSINTETREIVMSMSGPGGVKATPVAPFGRCTVVFGASDRVADLAGVSDDDIEVEIAGGRTLVWGHATNADAVEYDGAEGTAPFSWQAMTGSEKL